MKLNLVILTTVLLGTVAIAQPANDDFANAETMSTSFPVNVSNTNIGATAESGEPAHGGEAADHSIWYKIVAPATGALKYSAGSGTLVGIYTGASVGSLSTVPTLPGNSFFALSGTTYYFGLDMAAGATGTVSLRLNNTAAPANDLFSNRVTLPSSAMINTNGYNDNATHSGGGEPSHAGANDKSVWYQWTSPAAATYIIDTAGSPIDTTLGVYTSLIANVNSLTTIVDNDDDIDLTSKVSFSGVDGQTYYIAVATPTESAGGDFFLNFSSGPAAPDNDDFENAALLTGWPQNESGNNDAATAEEDEPQHDEDLDAEKSVWWLWTAPSNAVVSIDTFGSDFDTILAIYTGDELETLTQVGNNNDFDGTNEQSQVILEVTGGQDYYIAIDGEEGDGGPFLLNIDQVEYPEVLQMEINGPGNEFELAWSSEAGVNYALLQSTNMVNWVAFTNLVATNTQSSMILSLPTNELVNAFTVGRSL